jgi:hypothetical protein
VLGDPRFSDTTDLYRARNATSRVACDGAKRSPVRQLAGVPRRRSAIGSPYFQSISLGFECDVPGRAHRAA